MAKLRRSSGNRHIFWCPGCNEYHMIPLGDTQSAGIWGWNGSVDAPTITPSIMVNRGGANPTAPQCHSYVMDGKIQFMADCSHALAGKTVDIPDLLPESEESNVQVDQNG